MIAPEGYVPFSRLVMDTKKYKNEAKEYMGKNTSLCLLQCNDLLLLWLFEYCGNEVYLSDGSCRPVNIDCSLITENVFFWALINSKLGNSTNTKLKFDNKLIKDLCLGDVIKPEARNKLDAARNRYVEETGSDFEFSEEKIYKETIVKFQNGFGYVALYLFIDHRDFSISLSLYNHLANIESETVREAWSFAYHQDLDWSAKKLRPYQGYYLCVPKEVSTDGWDDFWKGKGQREFDADGMSFGISKLYKIGRPRLQESAAKDYNFVFPNGHTGTWKQALVTIKKETGNTWEPDTLKRGLGQK